MTLTASLLTGIDNAIAASDVPTYRHVGHTHAEFVDWARTAGVDGRIVDFLADREDCADTAPAAWVRLGTVGKSDWFKALPEDQRRAVTIGLVGDRGFKAYVAWMLDQLETA